MTLKFLVLSLILLSGLFVLPSTSNGYLSQSLGSGPTTFVVADSSYAADTVDPAYAYYWAYASAGQLIGNVYDTLVAFKGSDPNSVVPWLASSYSVSADGLTYEFVLRQNVPWQNASYGFVTPADVEYSLERVLVRDYIDGPAWMFWYPIFGQYAANLTDPVSQGIAIDNAITSNATGITIHIQTGKVYLPFLGILAQTWGSIVNRQWCIDQGDWNPAINKLSDGTWVNAHDPQPPTESPSPLDNPFAMMGSGPYKLDYINSDSWSIVRNPDFWGGWDANRGSLLGITTPSLGYLDRITWYSVSEYSTRLAGFTGANPVYDAIAVPSRQMSTVWQQPGIKCAYPLLSQWVDALFFSYNVSMLSPFIGSPTNATYFGQNGIRPDFFSDVHARKAVAYSLDWSQFIETAYQGEAQQPTLPLPVWDAFYNNSLYGYSFNIAKAIEEWKLAWGGQVWTNGFRFTIVTSGYRLIAAEMLKTALESENPLFHVDLQNWFGWSLAPVYSGGPGGRALGPIFIHGWMSDYADADDWATPFIHSSEGILAYWQHIDMDPDSPLMDNLIEWGRNNSTFAGRNANYQKLWQLYIRQVPSVPLQEDIDRQWSRDWVQGWYFNPIRPGFYGYTMWKQELPMEDVNSDGKVDIKDLTITAGAYGSYYVQSLLSPYPQGPPGYYSPNWNSKADVNVVNTYTGARSDMKIDIKDLAVIAAHYGYVAPDWQP